MKYIMIIILSILCFSSVFADLFEEQKIIERNINILPEDIAFFDLQGNKHFFDEFDGSTILIVFWASWTSESPDLILELDCLKKDFRKFKFDIIALSEDYQGIEKIDSFFKKYEIRHLKIYHDYKNQIYNAMKVTNLPSFFLLSSDSNSLYQLRGSFKWNDEYVRNSLLGFIPGNPDIPKNSSTKPILKFSPEYKSKNQSKPNKQDIVKREKDLPDAEKQDKNNITENNEQKND